MEMFDKYGNLIISRAGREALRRSGQFFTNEQGYRVRYNDDGYQEMDEEKYRINKPKSNVYEIEHSNKPKDAVDKVKDLVDEPEERFSESKGFFDEPMLFHVWWWQKHHGRWPKKDHQIHHIDGNKDNNNIENLQEIHKDEHGKISKATWKEGERKIDFIKEFDSAGQQQLEPKEKDEIKNIPKSKNSFFKGSWKINFRKMKYIPHQTSAIRWLKKLHEKW